MKHFHGNLIDLALSADFFTEEKKTIHFYAKVCLDKCHNLLFEEASWKDFLEILQEHKKCS
jgi:hypothetical protein